MNAPDLDPLLVPGEVGRPDQLLLAEDLLRPGDQAVELAVGLGAKLDQQGGRGRRQLEPVLGRTGDVLRGDHQGRGDHQLDGGGAGLDQGWNGLGGGLDAVEVKPGNGRLRRLRHGLEDRLGDEAERALRADQQPAEDLDGLVLVEEGAEPVAGRVLDPELAPDALAELRADADLVADLRQAPGQLRLRLGEALGRVGGGGVDHGAGRKHEGERADGAVGVRRHAAAHAARVVGEYAADAGDVGAGRVWAELAALRSEDPVGMAEDRPGPHPGPSATVDHLHPTPMTPDVDQDPVALGLAAEARPAGPEGDGHLRGTGVVEDLGDIGGVARHHHRPRQQPVGAGVGRVADQVDHAGEDAALSQEPDQLAPQRLRGAGGELVGRPVLGRLAPLRRYPGDVRRQQVHGAQLICVQPTAARARSRALFRP